MNKRPHPSFKRLATISLAPIFLALAACGSSGDQTLGEPPLKGASIGGQFTLTDEDGNTFDSRALDGKYWTIYFGYSFCPDVCPIDLQKQMQGFRVFEKTHPELAKKVQPLFVTIDPERDTPEVMKQYTDAFHPRLIGLTGSEEEIAAVAKQFVAYRQKRENEDGGDYLMDHSRVTYLFDPDGKPIMMLPVDRRDDGTPSTPEDIAKALEQWVK